MRFGDEGNLWLREVVVEWVVDGDEGVCVGKRVGWGDGEGGLG